jgi:hypothetical protein
MPERVSVVRRRGASEVRSVLGKPPLWLGEQFRGHRLRFVQVGKTGIPAKGKIARAASFVRFDYGIVRSTSSETHDRSGS